MSLVLEMKKEEKRKKLLDAAYLLFLQKGAGHTTINDIAEEAKVAKGTFYLYFAGAHLPDELPHFGGEL